MTSPQRRTRRKSDDSSSSSSSFSSGTLELLREITSSENIRLTTRPASSRSLPLAASSPLNVTSTSRSSRRPGTRSYTEATRPLLPERFYHRVEPVDVPEDRLSTSSMSTPTDPTVIYRHLSPLASADALPLTATGEEERTSLHSEFGVAPLMSASNSSGSSLLLSAERLRLSSEESETSPRIRRLSRRSTHTLSRDAESSSGMLDTAFISANLPFSSDSELSSLNAPEGSQTPRRKSRRSVLMFIPSPTLHVQGSSSDCTDSLTRQLLQLPPTTRSTLSVEPSPIQENLSTESSTKQSAEQFASPKRRSKRRRSQYQLSPFDRTDDSLSDTQGESSYLRATAKLFFMRHKPPPVMMKPAKQKPPFSLAVDPAFIGEEAYGSALREGAQLDDELRNDARSIEWILGPGSRCPCDVRRHPAGWSSDTVSNVHKYSFLLNCKDLKMLTESIVGWNRRKTIIFYQVVMVDGNPWKKKAEQVLRYIDVELDVGDQTAYNVLHYVQPCDRKILLVIVMDRVMGLVVAEERLTANRPHIETVCYRELEETPVPVKIGINQLWIHVSLRRYGLATKLCNILRKMFHYPDELNNEDFAFNDVSEMGVKFASSFLGTSKVPLYYGKSGR